MPVYFAVAVDLEVFCEELGVVCLVVVESVGVLGPGGHLEVDAELARHYYGGFTISRRFGLTNLFIYYSQSISYKQTQIISTLSDLSNPDLSAHS